MEAIHRVAARVAGVVPSVEHVKKALGLALDQIQRPFEEANQAGAMEGDTGWPEVSEKDRTKLVPIGGDWAVYMKAERDPDEGDYITIGWTLGSEDLWTGPIPGLGLSDEELDEAAEAVCDAMITSYTSGLTPD